MMVVTGSIMFVALFVACIVSFAVVHGRTKARAEAQGDLEDCMDRRNLSGVKSLLACRRHLLRTYQVREAEVWIAEHEIEVERAEEQKRLADGQRQADRGLQAWRSDA
jgi:hypothetical protein